MIPKEYLPIIISVTGGIVGGLAVVTSALITGRLTRRREEIAYHRQQQKERIEATRALYEDALMLLERTLRKARLGTDADEEMILRVLARMSLTSTEEIRTQYQHAADLVDKWAGYHRLSKPKDLGVIVTYTPAIQTKNSEAADKLWPEVETQRTRLQMLMQEHLCTLEYPVKRRRKLRQHA